MMQCWRGQRKYTFSLFLLNSWALSPPWAASAWITLVQLRPRRFGDLFSSIERRPGVYHDLFLVRTDEMACVYDLHPLLQDPLF